MKITKSIFYKNNHRQLAIIAENISSLYKAGIPFESIFHVMAELPLSKRYKVTLVNIKNTIQQGGSLWQGFNTNKELFPELFLAMLNIGEKTGRISDVLDSLAVYHKKMNKIETSLKNAMTYPMFILCCMFILGVLFITTIIPTFIGMYETMEKEIPSICISMMNIGNYIRGNPLKAVITFLSWVIAIPILLCAMFFKEFIHHSIAKIKLVKEFNEYIAVMLLLIIIKSGINLSEGLLICSENKMFFNLKESFSVMHSIILSGKSLNMAMIESKVFSKYSLAFIKIGEESGTIEEQLTILEKDKFSRLSISIDRKLEMIGPVIILIIGVLIVIFIIVVIMPLINGIFSGGVI